ncbi:MAG: ABC transporter substrate-binding protein [Dethiobacter sp.]|jgi:peptide/nickel transport system substrate-binding protein|nr:MAG: ABC transporter substrate-binding protein [Dethiobacter sp.]
MSRLTSGKNVLLLLLLVMCLLISGCGGNKVPQEKSAEGESPQEKIPQELVIGSPWTPKELDPVSAGWLVLRIGLVDTLVAIDYDINLVPGLAKSWEISSDELEWTFKLEEGVKFHDGTPLNAEAVKWSLERVMEKGTLFKDVPIKSIEARGDYTLTIVTEELFAPLAAILAKGEAAPVSKNSLDANGEFKEIIGTGPFMLSSWIPDQEAVLVRNDDYWGKIPTLDKVVYKGIPEAATRIMMLENKELDVAQILPADAVEQLEANPEIKVYTKPILRSRVIVLNMLREPFNDLRVRKAVNHAIDRESIVKHIMAGVDVAASGPFPPTTPWVNKNLQGYPYDLEKAKTLLAEAGWKDSDNSGIIKKDGKPFTVDLITYSTRAELPPMAEVIQDQLKKAGIQVNIQVLETGAAQSLREEGKFDMYLLARNLGFAPDPSYYLMSDFHSKNTGGKGWGAYGFNNKHVDELIELTQRTTNLQERKKYFAKLQEIIVDETPVMFLNHYVNVTAVRSNVQGYNEHPTESCFHLENIYIGE